MKRCEIRLPQFSLPIDVLPRTELWELGKTRHYILTVHNLSYRF